MISSWRSRGLVLTGLLVSAVLLSGCTTGSHDAGAGDVVTPEYLHLRKAARLVQEYTARNKKPPDSLAEVKKWAKNERKKGVDADTFTSTRDRQEYVLVDFPMGAALHEQTGQYGKVYASTPGQGDVQEFTVDRMNQMFESIKKSSSRYIK